MIILPLFFMEYFILSLMAHCVFYYITSFIDTFLLTDFQLLIFYFITLYGLKFWYDDELIYRNEELGEDKNDGVNYDIFFKFIQLSLDELWFFYSYILTEIKKYFFYAFRFRYRFSIRTNRTFLKKKIKNRFLLWRPIFKKWSYLGYYRANRSKWIK